MIKIRYIILIQYIKKIERFKIVLKSKFKKH